MPGCNERALEKAKLLAADALILDLEDAVAPDEKLRARDQVCAAVKGGGYGGREVVIRVNVLETPWGTADILAACDAEPDAILVPKVVHAGDIVSDCSRGPHDRAAAFRHGPTHRRYRRADPQYGRGLRLMQGCLR
jgi:citrate lyase beta subunit